MDITLTGTYMPQPRAWLSEGEIVTVDIDGLSRKCLVMSVENTYERGELIEQDASLQPLHEDYAHALRDRDRKY